MIHVKADQHHTCVCFIPTRCGANNGCIVPLGECSAVSCEIPHICPCTLSDRDGNKIRCDNIGSNWDLCVENPEYISSRNEVGIPHETMVPRKNLI